MNQPTADTSGTSPVGGLPGCFSTVAEAIRNSPDLLPSTCPGGPRWMVVSIRPEDWALPARRMIFALAGDERSDGLPGCRVVAG